MCVLGLRFRVWGTAGLRSPPGEVLLTPFQIRKCGGSRVLCVGLRIAARRIEKDPGLSGPCYRLLCDYCSMWVRWVGFVAQVWVLVRGGG
jgi:hypothetical protein